MTCSNPLSITMAGNNRFTGTTYYDFLQKYFELQFATPLSASEQALMTHILHLCNLARSDVLQTSERRLAFVTNLNSSTIHQSLSRLSEKHFINVQALPNNCTVIDLQPLNDCLQNSENVQAESAFSAPKIREERQERKKEFPDNFQRRKTQKKLNLYEVDLSKDWWKPVFAFPHCGIFFYLRQVRAGSFPKLSLTKLNTNFKHSIPNISNFEVTQKIIRRQIFSGKFTH